MEVLRQVITFGQLSDLKRALTSFGSSKTFTKQTLASALLSYSPETDSEVSVDTLVDVVVSHLLETDPTAGAAGGIFTVVSLSGLLTSLETLLVQSELTSSGNAPQPQQTTTARTSNSGSNLKPQQAEDEEDAAAQLGELSFEASPAEETSDVQTGSERLLPAFLTLIEKLAVVTDRLNDVKPKLETPAQSGNTTSLNSSAKEDIEKIVQKLHRYKDSLSGLHSLIQKLQTSEESHEREVDRLTHRIRELELDFSNLQAVLQQVGSTSKQTSPTRAFSQVLGVNPEENDEIARLRAQVEEMTSQLDKYREREALLQEKIKLLENIRTEASSTKILPDTAELIQSLHNQRDIDAKLMQTLHAENASLKTSLDEEKRTVEAMRKEFAVIKNKIGESALHDSGIQFQASKLANFYRTSNLPISFCNEEQATGKYRLLQPAGTGESAPGMEQLQVVRLSSRESVINIHDSHFAQFLKTLPTQPSANKKDYLGLRFKPNVLADISRFGENLSEGNFLSDYVVVYDRKQTKKRLAIVITQEYLFLHNADNWKQVYFSPLSQVKVVSISSKNCALVNLENETTDKNLLLETYRRTELVIYIARMQREAAVPVYAFRIRKNLACAEIPAATGLGRVFFGGKSEGAAGQLRKESTGRDSPGKDKARPSREGEVHFLQETLRNSKKSGYVKVPKKTFFGQKTFTEYFCVLCDLGLLGFKKYGEKQPAVFIPILGGTAKRTEDAKERGTWELSFDSENYMFQSASDSEAEEWLKFIKQLQSKALTSKDTLREMGKAT